MKYKYLFQSVTVRIKSVKSDLIYLILYDINTQYASVFALGLASITHLTSNPTISIRKSLKPVNTHLKTSIRKSLQPK